MDITSISKNVLGEASQAMDCGVYLVQCVRCPTVPSDGVLVGNAGFRVVFTMRWWRIVPWL
jgi:hypothetical protein